MKIQYWRLYLSIIIITSGRIDCANNRDLTIWKLTNLKLIIRGSLVERYGVARKPESEWVPSINPKEDRRMNNEICRNVINTPFFETWSEYWIDMERRTNRLILKHRFPHLTIFEKSAHNKKHGWFWFLTDSFDYDNTYKVRGKFTEIQTVDICPLVFTCLVQRWSSRNIKEYFVSQPHYVSFPAFDVTDIVGRFVFTIEREKLYLKALAVDSTDAKPTLIVELNSPNGLEDLTKLRSVFANSDD